MSTFRCGRCERYVDGDYDGCFMHPFDDCACLCEDCSIHYNCHVCGEGERKVISLTRDCEDKYICKECNL